MPIDARTPQSPGWWLHRLLNKLSDRQARYDLLDTYYRGENGIPVHATKAVREAYQRLMSLARTNFAELSVEAVRERMLPVGFRTGASGDENTDAEAWRIWQANSLDADSALIHRASLALSMGYVIVGGVDPDIGAPLITPEDPREVITESAPGRRRKTIAGLKVFRDDTWGTDRAYLYLPGFVVKAGRPAAGDTLAIGIDGWEWDSNPERLPAPIVPVVPFPNRADMAGAAMGEFEPHLPLLDRINYVSLNGLEIATLQAFRQRAVKGVPNVDEDGNEVDYDDLFASGPDALWVLPATAEMWESGQVDLNPIRQLNRDNVNDFAAVTRTPISYLTPDAANGSAEGASLTREGLVFKTGDRIVQAGESHELVMSYAFLFANDETRAKRSDLEVLWAPPDRVSLAEKFDAAVKAKAADVPWRTRMQLLGYSPQEINRMEKEKQSDALRDQAAATLASLTGGSGDSGQPAAG